MFFLRVCLLVAVLISLHSFATEARGNEDLGVYAPCHIPRSGQQAVWKGELAVRSFFTKRGDSHGSRLFLSAKKPEGGCAIRHEDGQPVRFANWDYAAFIALCRDPATGLDRAVMHVAAHVETVHNLYDEHFLQVWGVEPGTGMPVMLYDEAVFRATRGETSWNEGNDKWDMNPFVREGGVLCREWMERTNAHLTFRAAMKALRIGAGVEVGGSAITLPTRSLHPEEARKWLGKLAGIANIKGVIFADAAARSSWRVVQVLGKRFCDAEGVVLLLDLERNAWRTIYDVPTGCTKSLNFPLRGALVKGDRLYVSMCRDCSWRGVYGDYSIDLLTHRAEPILPGSKAPGPRKLYGIPEEDELFMIRDLDEYLSPDGVSVQ